MGPALITGRKRRCNVRATFGIGALFVSLALIGQAQHAYDLSGDFWGTHDPSIMKQGDTWYVFATGKAAQGGQFTIRC